MKCLVKLVFACAVFFVFSGLSANAQVPLFQSTMIGSDPGEIIGGVNSGGAAWRVTLASISISEPQRNLLILSIHLKGLVLVSTGMSPVSQIAASLVCGGSGGAVVGTTDTFGLTADGNSDFDDEISIGSSCLAPVVIVRAVGANGPGAFIAASGFQVIVFPE